MAASISGGGKLGPVGRNGGVQIELALLDQSQCAQGGQSLRGRVEVNQRVVLPGLGAGLVFVPTPEIHHGDTMKCDGDGGTQFVPFSKALLESVADLGEAGIAGSRDLRCRGSAAHLRSPWRGGLHGTGRIK